MAPRSTILSSILAAALSAAAGSAAAQIAPRGMVDDPCQPASVIPRSFIARAQATFDPARTGPLPAVPAADLATYAAQQAERVKNDWANLCRFRDDNRRLAALPAAARQVVFMGDSITQNWGLAAPGLFRDGVINRGISGQTTPQMLVRFQADVIALKPRVVHIMAGTNDVAGNTGPTSAQDVRNNIMAMVALAKSAKVRVVLASIPPAAAFSWSPDLKPSLQIQALNAWLRDYAREQGAIYVDDYSILATPDGAMKPELTLDGVHPNLAGYAAIEPLTRKALRDALR